MKKFINWFKRLEVSHKYREGVEFFNITVWIFASILFVFFAYT